MEDELAEIMDRKMKEIMSKRTSTQRSDYPIETRTPLVVSDDNFDAFVKSYPVVVVDCWASWCGPCKMLEPVIDDLTNHFRGKIVFGKLNVDANPNTVSKFRIMSIPTLLVFKNGRLQENMIGFQPKSRLLDFFSRLVR